MLFIILMSPVIKAAMNEIPMATFAIKIRANGPGSLPSLVKTANNIELRMKAAAKPTDHLPKELFGRILIRTMLSYATMWVEVNIPVRVCQHA